jgi:GH25 family lysozyme M1 (1,4-beta-N-acetylmuramidase)
MAVNGIQDGRDVSVAFTGEGGAPLAVRPEDILSFTSRQVVKEMSKLPIAGPPVHGHQPQGWQGDIEFNTVSDDFDKYVARVEAAYYGGTSIRPATILETIRKPDGSVTQYRYLGVSFGEYDTGGAKGEGERTRKYSWKASQRVER